MGTILALVAMFVAATIALPVGGGLTAVFGWWAWPWAGPILVFILVLLILNAMAAGVVGVFALAGGGLWSSSITRWVIGKAAVTALLIAVVVALYIIDQTVLGGPTSRFVGLSIIAALTDPLHTFVPFMGATDPNAAPGWQWFQWAVSPLLRLWLLLMIGSVTVGFVRSSKVWLAYGTLPMRRIWRAMKFGLGGSSHFEGLLDEWQKPWKPGQIILGTSMYEPGHRLGRTDDRHLLTIATTRAGKGRSCIIPNLLTYPGPALVIDPKGENAAVTANARRRMGQAAYFFDPFGLLQKLPIPQAQFKAHRLNILAAIDLTENDVAEQIGNVADALITHSVHGNPFWDDAAKAVLLGIIAHVLTWDGLRDDERHLGTVRDYILEINGRQLKQMAGHAGAAGLTTVAVAELKRAGGSTGRSDMLDSIFTTLGVHTKWLDSPALRDSMSASDFNITTLKKQDATLYLIIPQEYLGRHSRFLRLFITIALRTATRGVKGKHPMLFILDEFNSLGPLKVIEEAAGLMAGGGVRLWPIIQNLTQLKQYGDNWETFIGNAGQIQLFAANDQSTIQYFSERLGHHLSWRKVSVSNNRKEWVPQSPTWFRTSAELARESSRDSGRAVIFFEGGTQALVSRASYDKIFSADDYDHNPYLGPEPETLLDRGKAWLFGLGWGQPRPGPDPDIKPEREAPDDRDPDEVRRTKAAQGVAADQNGEVEPDAFLAEVLDIEERTHQMVADTFARVDSLKTPKKPKRPAVRRTTPGAV